MTNGKNNTWAWPETFGRRFFFAMAIYQPVGFIASLLVGWAKHLPLAATMLEIWVWVFVIGTIISLGQAGLARPGASFWRPLLGADS